jgi:hypothetical protein
LPTIEENIGRIADALEAIAKLAANPITTTITNIVADETPKAETVKATATRTTSGKAKDKTTVPAVEEAPTVEEAPAAVEVDPLAEPAGEPPTIDEVRAALKAYRDVEGAAAMMEVLKNHGAANLQDLKVDQYAAIIAAVK